MFSGIITCMVLVGFKQLIYLVTALVIPSFCFGDADIYDFEVRLPIKILLSTGRSSTGYGVVLPTQLEAPDKQLNVEMKSAMQSVSGSTEPVVLLSDYAWRASGYYHLVYGTISQVSSDTLHFELDSPLRFILVDRIDGREIAPRVFRNFNIKAMGVDRIMSLSMDSRFTIQKDKAMGIEEVIHRVEAGQIDALLREVELGKVVLPEFKRLGSLNIEIDIDELGRPPQELKNLNEPHFQLPKDVFEGSRDHSQMHIVNINNILHPNDPLFKDFQKAVSQIRARRDFLISKGWLKSLIKPVESSLTGATENVVRLFPEKVQCQLVFLK